MYHIKEGNNYLCGGKPDKHKKEMTISFTAAQKASLSICCALCKSEFIKRINGLAKVIEHNDRET